MRGRPATGQVVRDPRRRSPIFALRFRADGRRHYLTLGTEAEGWTQAKAELELQNVLADVRRAIWRPPKQEPAITTKSDPLFHEFASEWFEAHRLEWRPKTVADYEWQLSHHLLPFFAGHRLSQITIAEVDRYRRTKVAEAEAVRTAKAEGEPHYDEFVDRAGRTHKRARRPLSATSINKTLTRLSQILELAVEYQLIPTNAAKGKRRRLKSRRKTPVWIDNAEHIQALLAAAGELDRRAERNGGRGHKGTRPYRRALLSTLLFAGLRISELTALRWRDVDLAGRRILVRDAKADDGVAEVDLLPTLHDELSNYKANAASTAPEELVFTSTVGTTLSDGNIRYRVLTPSVKVANAKLGESALLPLPEGLTPHKLRHTFASLLIAAGVDPGSVMDQLRHTDPSFTLRVYRHAMRRGPEARRRLATLVRGASWEPGGDAHEDDYMNVTSKRVTLREL